MKSSVIVAIAVVALLAVVAGYFFFNSYDPIDSACTQDVQQCSDGSYVSRNPRNNCEFFDCPGLDNDTIGDPGSAFPEYVDISGMAFVPSTIEIFVGHTITWTNSDSAWHTVTSDSGNELASSTLHKGESYTHTFNQAGTYDYHCSFHSGMKGKIIVK